MSDYAKVVVMGSPITKSNFKMHNADGRAILPRNSGTRHDRYALYEEQIAIDARSQNPGVTMEESLIAILRVYYKSEKRHPDTINITKSIFDGIEKSGLILNDAQVRRVIIEEYYDKVEPRFELELFAESVFRMSYEIRRHDRLAKPILYKPTSTRSSLGLPGSKGFTHSDLEKIKANLKQKAQSKKKIPSKKTDQPKPTPTEQHSIVCSICKKATAKGNYIKGDGGKTIICKQCFKKLY